MACPWHVRELLAAIEYRGEHHVKVAILMPDGFLYRLRVWWKDTVQDLLVKIADRVGHGVYKIEMWQSQMVNGKIQVALLQATGKNYECPVDFLPELQVMLKVKDWLHDEIDTEEEGE